MTIRRRGFLKTMPLVALAATSVEATGGQAQRYELEEKKRYIFVISDGWEPEAMKELARNLTDMGINAVVVYDRDSSLNIYEVQ